jgi:hypothetical protein
MENIQPVLWSPVLPEATQIQVWNNNDDLETQCNFGWQLLTATGQYVDTGAIACTGDQYQQWDGNRQWPYNFVCDFLGLTLIQ